MLLDNTIKILEEVGNSAVNAGRTVDEIFILPVVKGRSYAELREFGEAGFSVVGENRVQEFLRHHKEVPGLKWHFIGQLQTNKVKYIIGKCELIHSLDRVGLAKEIDRVSQARGVVTRCLVEVNLLGEANKGGLMIEGEDLVSSGINTVKRFLDEVNVYRNIEVVGLMTVMPQVPEFELEMLYEALGRIYDFFKRERRFQILSAGMSGDFKIAIKHGANLLRLGRIFFEGN